MPDGKKFILPQLVNDTSNGDVNCTFGCVARGFIAQTALVPMIGVISPLHQQLPRRGIRDLCAQWEGFVWRMQHSGFGAAAEKGVSEATEESQVPV